MTSCRITLIYGTSNFLTPIVLARFSLHHCPNEYLILIRWAQSLPGFWLRGTSQLRPLRCSICRALFLSQSMLKAASLHKSCICFSASTKPLKNRVFIYVGRCVPLNCFCIVAYLVLPVLQFADLLQRKRCLYCLKYLHSVLTGKSRKAVLILPT